MPRSIGTAKSTQQGSGDYQPKLTVRTYQTEKSLTIEIENNGPGIPDEMKDKIVQPFFMTKKGTQGTGLGLSITNDIVKAHGGSLDITSFSSEKTIFTITLNVMTDSMKIQSYFFKFTATLFLLCFFTQISVQAQSDAFRHITPRDGLPSGFIQTMTQDSKGFVWIGTNVGLAKHDGYSTTAYRNDPEDSTTISEGLVYDIIEYDETTFFLGTDGGLNLFNPATDVFDRFSVPDSLPDLGIVRDLLLLDEHSMWIAAGSGLFHVDPTTLRDVNPNVEFFEIPGLEANQTANLTALATDSLNNLWVGSDSTLFQFDLEAKNFVDIGPVNDDAARVLEGNIWSMLYTSGNHLIITSLTGLAILKDGDDGFEEVKQLGEHNAEELRSIAFQSITEDPEGKIWLGTGLAGAFHWDIETGDVVNYRASSNNDNTIASDDVHYAFEDREGNIWFGYHFEGASVMYSDSWNYEVHKPFPDLPSSDPKNIIMHTYMDDKGMLWATTVNGLIRDLGTDDQEFFHFDFSDYESLDESQYLFKIQNIHNDKVYIVSEGNENTTGYIVFDPEKDGDPFSILSIPNELNITPGTGVSLGDVFYGGVFNANSIIRTNLNSGEIELIDLPVQGEYTDASISISFPHFIYENDLYVQVYFFGTPGGVKAERFILNLDSGEIRTHELTVSDPIVGLQPPLVSSYEPGILYLNTITGLFRIDNLNNSYTLLFEDQMSLLREGALMTEDDEGYIWVNNLTGITRVDPLTESVDYFEIPREEYTPNRTFPTTLPSGEIIFPGDGSYLRFNPADLTSTQPAGETLITSLKAGTEEFELIYNAEELEIENNQNTLTFNFIGLDFRNPASIHYRYRILGSENEQWTQVGTQRSIFIPNLPAGDYTFEVQSGSQYGSFDGQAATLNFSVLPPWWNTVPAYIMYLLLFGGIVFGADRLQRRRLISKERERAQKRELEQEKAHARQLEEAYSKLEESLNKLTAAQDQLVQQEKLASLGQLTAGIAHEIKNPLNFVNNFSELSVELVEEMRHEIREMRREMEGKKSPLEGGSERSEQGDDRAKIPSHPQNIETDSDSSNTPLNPLSPMRSGQARGEAGSSPQMDLILEILDDIEMNLKKIHEHGTRADGIVKSMLQHSRGGSGKMEPTDLNEVLKEFVNLSFHGMRASKNPINVDLEFDLDESIGKVPLIAEDFSRVIINLSNNAFDAMREKLHSKDLSGLDDYLPKLTVRTHQKDSNITIEIKDNGPGIPEEMKDKILQPFFTTKKGTQGTGLGLSITNDIVKAHGGFLDIDSKSGEFTQFRITIPVKPHK